MSEINELLLELEECVHNMQITKIQLIKNNRLGYFKDAYEDSKNFDDNFDYAIETMIKIKKKIEELES